MEPEKETQKSEKVVPEQVGEQTETQNMSQAQPEANNTPLLAPVPFYKGKTFLLWLLIVVVLAGLGYYAHTNDFFEPAVAEVNGVKITQSRFDEGVELITNNATAQGINLAEIGAEEMINQQVLDVLILNTLIKEASEDLGIEVTKEEINEQYSELVSSLEEQLEPGETVESRMAEAGIDVEALKVTIEEQLLADKYIESVTDIENIEVSEEEVAEFYEALSEASPDIPPLNDIEEQLRLQLKSDKEQQIIGELLEELRNEAEIIINI